MPERFVQVRWTFVNTVEISMHYSDNERKYDHRHYLFICFIIINIYIQQSFQRYLMIKSNDTLQQIFVDFTVK